MAERALPPVERGARADPIERIARADGLVPADPPEAPDGAGPDLQPVPRPLAPAGLAAELDAALGPVVLPRAMELVEALDQGQEAAILAAAVDPGLQEVLSAVLKDEERKLMRYMDLRNG